MSYYINMKAITLDDYKNKLLNDYLIPSQRILRENIDDYFKQLHQQSIFTMEDLYLRLKSKSKVEEVLSNTTIPEEYIKVLARALKSYIGKSRKIIDYPLISKKTRDILLSMEIKTSSKLFNYLIMNSRSIVMKKLDITQKEYNIIYSLMDVTRLRYVSPLFATVLVESGYLSIEDISKAEANDMYNKIKTTNDMNKIYKGNIGVNDMRFLIEDGIFFVD